MTTQQTGDSMSQANGPPPQGEAGLPSVQSWHALPTDEVVHIFHSHPEEGLSLAEAERRYHVVGPNTISKGKGPHPLILFLRQFNNPLVYVLLVAGGITIALPGHTVDSIVIFSAVILNAIIGHLQESRAQAAIEALSHLIKVICTVIRDGETDEVDAARLVPGDLVAVESGDRIPADLRLLEVHELQVNESMLTGESLPVSKQTAPVAVEEGLADRTNMAYSGTLVTYGQATGLVVATGSQTELGRISQLLETTETLTTPLTRRLRHFSTLLSWVIIAFAVVIFGVGLLHGQDIQATFVATIAFAVAAIPEGLPAAVTIILAIGVTRMAKRHAVIRKLPAVETLGSTTIIGSDKTGTLTKNEMTVTALVAGGHRYAVSGTGYAPEGMITWQNTVIDLSTHPAARECLLAGILCNNARLVYEADRWVIEGDPTEGALLVAGRKATLDLETLEDEFQQVGTISFESARRYMATLHRTPEGDHVIYLKGSVEKVLSICETVLLSDGRTVPLDHQAICDQADELAAEGQRVLAFARKAVPATQTTLVPTDVEAGMVFLGLQGMIDPPRPEAITAIHDCQQAGILVKMITGDHPLTAQAIAQQMGITNSHVTVLTGQELDGIADESLPAHALATNVFARVAPEQKLRLVQALQATGAVVAMTGDGVNDAPALQRADIGIAMGKAGTEVAKDAADMVLTDDNFASIAAAVEEGRGVYDNLRKFITWTLPTNAGESLLVLVAIVAGIAIPILPGHVLWVNLTTSLLLGMMLAFEPKEAGLMQRPARDPKEPMFTRPLQIRTLYVAGLMVIGAYGLYEWQLYQGVSIVAARTIVVNVVVLVQLVYLFNCRSLTQPVTKVGMLTNRWALIGALGMLALQLVFVYTPVMQRLFETEAVPWDSWLEVALLALLIAGVVEWEKALRRRRENLPPRA